MIDLIKAEEFHGHLGPYLTLGLRAGDLAINALLAKKYFGIEVVVYCPDVPPGRCFIDGIQLSTGATYGKGNISFINDKQIKTVIKNKENGEFIEIVPTPEWSVMLEALTVNDDLEAVSRQILSAPQNTLFVITRSFGVSEHK